MSLADWPQVQALSVREKLELVDELWKSVSSDIDAMDTTREEKGTLNDRWETFLRNPSSALIVDQFRKELSALHA